MGLTGAGPTATVGAAKATNISSTMSGVQGVSLAVVKVMAQQARVRRTTGQTMPSDAALHCSGLYFFSSLSIFHGRYISMYAGYTACPRINTRRLP